MIFMERNNELDPFAKLNIKQMEAVGSNEYINIVVYMHYSKNNIKKTKVLLVGKKQSTLLRETITNKQAFNIKDELVQFCKKTIQAYPAKDYSLIFWNHGTGATEPCHRSATSNIFSFAFAKQHPRSQHTTHLMRNIAKKNYPVFKGLCFDDSAATFLCEKQLQEALKTICATSLCNKKFSLIGFDACFMSMIEVGSSIRNYANYMVGSQEVELGTGWNYARVFAPFLFGSVSSKSLSEHIVNSYAKTYKNTSDYTQSAINLSVLPSIESNVHAIAQQLLSLLAQDKENTIYNALRLSRNKHFCTHFDDPDFVDLQHFYQNLLGNISQIKIDNAKSNKVLFALKQELEKGCTLIKKAVMANKAGIKRPQATGLSIYFPEKYIHASYYKSAFTLSDQSWINFLRTYLSQ
jgi:hypothetical protein